MSEEGRVKPESVTSQRNEFDGHINRNIRLALALIDLVKPYIEVVNYIVSTEDVTLEWRVNGCFKLNQARVTVGNREPTFVLPTNQSGFCNYMGP